MILWRCCIDCGAIYFGEVSCEVDDCDGVAEPIEESIEVVEVQNEQQ